MEPAAEYAVQGSEQWKRARLGNVGASRLDDILTEPRSKADREVGRLSQTAESYMLELLGEILTGLPANDFETPATRWGNQWEPEARSVYEEAMDCDVDQTGFHFHPNIPHCGCSPDGMIGDDGLLEIKCPHTTREHVRTAISQAVPDQYVAQVQGQLWVTGRKWSHFVSYDPRIKDTAIRLIIVPVQRDEEMIAKIDAAVRRFVRLLLESVEALGAT